MGFLGIIIVFACVFGTFAVQGGSMHVIIHAALGEMIIIGGAAFGAYVIANPMKTVKMGIKLGMKSLTSKGGDWAVDQIVGAPFVQSYGGEVRSLHFVDGKSTTKIIAKAQL
jgi:bifunctional ADP-heptose synthase (sugar kinase/adenylyltransferase)